MLSLQLQTALQPQFDSHFAARGLFLERKSTNLRRSSIDIELKDLLRLEKSLTFGMLTACESPPGSAAQASGDFDVARAAASEEYVRNRLL
jgi:hypothetical protein